MNETTLVARIDAIKKKFPDVECNWQELNTGAFIIILRGGFKEDDPTAYMNEAVSTLVKNELYNQFIEEFLDNPWTRIIIFGFNNIEFN